MEQQVLAFTRASVADAPEVEFCVDLAAGDLVAEWLMDHHRIDEPIMRTFLGLVEPGMRVLDLGCHIGTFSLPASALGAEVIALDASPQHVNLMRHAARRNGFDRLQVIHAAVTASEQPVAFVERSIHSHIQLAEEGDASTVTVPTTTVDELVRARGWSGVDVVKMDIEGNEIAALAGMEGLFSAGGRPSIVFECNGGMLPAYGGSICRLRGTLVELGYELLLIDHLRPGILVEALADGVQPECASDYLAVVVRPEGLASRWQIEPPLSLEQTSSRLLAAAASDAEGYRRYCAEVIAHGPGWLRADAAVQAGFRALQLDRSPLVRAACVAEAHDSPALGHVDTPEPDSGTAPSDAVVWARSLELRQPVDEPDLPPGSEGERRTGPAILEGLSFHVRAGELLAVRGATHEGSALLDALAGLVRPAAGSLHVEGPAVLISALGDGMEQELSVSENMLLFGAFLGCHVPGIARRLPALAELAGVTDWLGSALCDAPPVLAVRIALTVALECAHPRLLLVDELPPLSHDPFARWSGERAAALCAGGMAIVQLVDDPERLLCPASRVMWLEDREVRCCGHPQSVLDACWRAGFDPSTHSHRSPGRVRVRV